MLSFPVFHEQNSPPLVETSFIKDSRWLFLQLKELFKKIILNLANCFLGCLKLLSLKKNQHKIHTETFTPVCVLLKYGRFTLYPDL